MANVIKVKSSLKLGQKRELLPKVDYSLPETKTEPSENLFDYSFLIFGRKKIGKTTLTARFPGAIHFMFEPGASALRLYKVPKEGDCFSNWRDVRGFVKSLQKATGTFQTAVFDTGEAAYKLCMKFMCEELNISHPGKVKDWGASWGEIANEFQSAHLGLASAGMGFVVLAHEKEESFENWDGKTYDRIKPKFGKSTEDFYEGVVDNIFYYHYIGAERWLTIRGDETIVAGTRCEGHFMTVDGRLITKIPMGKNPDEGFDNLMKAFNNEQERSFGPDEEIDKPKKGGLVLGKKKLVLKK